jgi:hypothetical protein
MFIKLPEEKKKKLIRQIRSEIYIILNFFLKHGQNAKAHPIKKTSKTETAEIV